MTMDLPRIVSSPNRELDIPFAIYLSFPAASATTFCNELIKEPVLAHEFEVSPYL